MIFLHVDSDATAAKLNEYISGGKHVFALVYMEGCGPCMATRPEWAKLEKLIGKKYKSNDNVVIADVDKNFAPHVGALTDLVGFPTMKYIRDNGTFIEEFEQSSIGDTGRTTTNFVKWIESHIGGGMRGGAKSKRRGKRGKRGKRTHKRRTAKKTTPVSSSQELYARLMRKSSRRATHKR
jgi:hypothetical protein